ncbi:hypothetical protein Agabi119p4_10495 [Agaricus bisporus var. burnettii]|uniref:Uncharacterized protein n=1 Tax=Agaricus bisporus var. burnettii TaxID=192524 RepID=A0A8H7C2C7_AGABI|nr:hypothetical protein Agabi119p4_10495 [Agaricus bisporus var. burnettii]
MRGSRSESSSLNELPRGSSGDTACAQREDTPGRIRHAEDLDMRPLRRDKFFYLYLFPDLWKPSGVYVMTEIVASSIRTVLIVTSPFAALRFYPRHNVLPPPYHKERKHLCEGRKEKAADFGRFIISLEAPFSQSPPGSSPAVERTPIKVLTSQ